MINFDRAAGAAWAATAGATIAGVAGAMAAEPSKIEVRRLIEGEAKIEVQNDFVFDSDDPGSEIDDLFATIELKVGINLTDMLSVQSLFVLEPVLDPTPFDDRVFEDHGAYAEELYLQVKFDNVRFFGGKYDASFGTAWDGAVTPGIYGTGFAEDYELAERIGLGGEITLGDMYTGMHTLRGNFFLADRTDLSESIFTNRGHLHLSDGGPSNTEGLDSLSFTLDGKDIPGLVGVTYHLGFRHQSPGIGDVSNETGFAAGLQKMFVFEDGSAFRAIAEGVALHHADAGPDDVYYLTLGGEYTTGPWIFSGSYTARDTHVIGGSDFTDHLAQVTAGYEVLPYTTLNAGYQYTEEGGVESHTFGLLFSMEIKNITNPMAQFQP